MNLSQKHAHQKTLHAAYVAQRVDAEKFALEIGGRYERMLSLVAGGALAVSLTFIEKVSPSPIPYSQWIVLSSWMFLTSAIIASLVAIYQSQNAQQKKIENLDTEILQALHPDDKKYKGIDTSLNPFSRKVFWANRISLWSTLIGLLSLVLFAFVNFPPPNQNERQKISNTTEKSDTSKQTADDQRRHIRANQESGSTTSSTTVITEERKIRYESKSGPKSQDSPETDEGDSGVIHTIPESSPATTSSSSEGIGEKEIKIEANKTPQPTPMAVTSPAAQETRQPIGAAHLSSEDIRLAKK